MKRKALFLNLHGYPDEVTRNSLCSERHNLEASGPIGIPRDPFPLLLLRLLDSAVMMRCKGHASLYSPHRSRTVSKIATFTTKN